MLSRASFYAFLALSLLPAYPVAANAQDELAKKAKAVLEKHCASCHDGQRKGGNKGQFDIVLKRKKLVETLASTKKESLFVTPGKPDQSAIYTRMIDKGENQMPPEYKKVRPTEKEIDTIREWIQKGAVDFDEPATKRRFIENLEVLDLIRKDLEKVKGVNEDSARLQRYFVLTHLYNADLTEKELADYRAGLSKLINSLSWGQFVVKPRIVDGSEGTILAINLTDYEWNEKAWEHILAANPYGVTYAGVSYKNNDNKVDDICRQLTGCAIPYVRADWFVFAASRPPLYHDILGLPQTLQELERMVLPHTSSVAENVRLNKVFQAGFNGPTGVSDNNRIMQRHNSADQNGYFWLTFDFRKRTDKDKKTGLEVDHPERVIFLHPLGPDGPNAFQHGGGEMIFSLHNGLQGYFLCDATGKRLDDAPEDIVKDREQGGAKIFNGISCMGCHNYGLKEKSDDIRDYVDQNPKAFGAQEKKKILSLYRKNTDLKTQFEKDVAHFRKAVEQTGAEWGEIEPISALSSRFESNIDLDWAAAEVGVTKSKLVEALDNDSVLARNFGLLKTGRRIRRDDMLIGFRNLVKALDPAGKVSSLLNNPVVIGLYETRF